MVIEENERNYSILETDHGLVGMTEVGARMALIIAYRRRQRVVRCKELGWEMVASIIFDTCFTKREWTNLKRLDLKTATKMQFKSGWLSQ